jgi:predicted transcriptional regulator
MKEAEVVIDRFQNISIPTKRVAIVSQEKASRRFRQMRKGYGITLADLARETGVALSTICHLEGGKMPWTNKSANRLFAALDELIAVKTTA